MPQLNQGQQMYINNHHSWTMIFITTNTVIHKNRLALTYIHSIQVQAMPIGCQCIKYWNSPTSPLSPHNKIECMRAYRPLGIRVTPKILE